MKLYIAKNGVVKPHRDLAAKLLMASKYSRNGHSVVQNQNDADLALEVDFGGRQYFVSKKIPVFTYSSRDEISPARKGIYPSIANHNFNSAFVRSGPYFEFLDDERYVGFSALSEAKYLYSFCGASWTSEIRKKIFELGGSRSFMLDSGNDPGNKFNQSAETYAIFKARYLESLRNSKFVLCPRGMGASSIRLFESMKAGRVPVIISDEWVPPLGPEWDAFSIRVRESEITRIPSMLESMEDSAVGMGLEARKAYETNFALESIFDWFMGQMIEMLDEQKDAGNFRSWVIRRYMDHRNWRKANFREAINYTSKASLNALREVMR